MRNKEEYDKMVNTIFFNLFFPHLTGNWELDKITLNIEPEPVIKKQISQEEIWQQIEKSYLENPQENSIINSIDKYVDKLKEKELIYKDCLNCDSGMMFINDAIKILKELYNDIR